MLASCPEVVSELLILQFHAAALPGMIRSQLPRQSTPISVESSPTLPRTSTTVPCRLTQSDILTLGGVLIPAFHATRRQGCNLNGIGRQRALMRWLMIVLLVSLAGLLAAALGVARHIWVQRSQQHLEPGTKPELEAEMAEEAESEVEL